MATEAAATTSKKGEQQEALTRWQAQKHFGLVGQVDWVLGSFVVIGIVGTLLSAILPFVSIGVVCANLGLTLLFAAIWIIILLYRVLVFLLDLHADIALMPESAARIVAGYYEGKKAR